MFEVGSSCIHYRLVNALDQGMFLRMMGRVVEVLYYNMYADLGIVCLGQRTCEKRLSI